MDVGQVSIMIQVLQLLLIIEKLCTVYIYSYYQESTKKQKKRKVKCYTRLTFIVMYCLQANFAFYLHYDFINEYNVQNKSTLESRNHQRLRESQDKGSTGLG